MTPAERDAALALMRGQLSTLHPVEDTAWADFSAVWHPFHAPRRTVLTLEGATERYVYFVLEGVQHAYAVHETGQASTLVFSYPHSFSGVADSFLLQQPSRYVFETLTASTFLRASFHGLDAALLRHHGLERMFRLAISHTLSGVLVRQTELQSLPAIERLRRLWQRSPHLFQLVPHKHIASYLGMDATNLSKLMSDL